EFIAEFDSLCDEIPTFFAIACKAEVDQYGPTIYQDLQNDLEPDTICDGIHMCHESLVAPVEGSVECIACKQIVQTIEDKYVDGMLYDDLYDLVIEECDKLPEWIAVVCDSEVDYYLPQMWTMLVDDHIEPQEMCALLGQCKKSAAPKGNDVTCEVCEIIVDAVEDAWLPNITYQELYNTIMNDTCRKLPHVLEIACEAEVDEYLPEIYSMMQNAVASSTICGLLTLCESTAAPVESSFECDLCEFLVTELEERFLPSMTEEEFIAEFDSLCDEIPTFFAIACKAEVDQYGPTIYQDLQNGLEPDTICDEIHMFSAKSHKSLTSYEKSMISFGSPNFGNSCYLNSAVICLKTMRDIILPLFKRGFHGYAKIEPLYLHLKGDIVTDNLTKAVISIIKHMLFGKKKKTDLLFDTEEQTCKEKKEHQKEISDQEIPKPSTLVPIKKKSKGDINLQTSSLLKLN
ncbi:hypothetical protein ADUPG1_013351, partial [Aduncisulcus paluster]